MIIPIYSHNGYREDIESTEIKKINISIYPEIQKQNLSYLNSHNQQRKIQDITQESLQRFMELYLDNPFKVVHQEHQDLHVPGVYIIEDERRN